MSQKRRILEEILVTKDQNDTDKKAKKEKNKELVRFTQNLLQLLTKKKKKIKKKEKIR